MALLFSSRNRAVFKLCQYFPEWIEAVWALFFLQELIKSISSFFSLGLLTWYRGDSWPTTFSHALIFPVKKWKLSPLLFWRHLYWPDFRFESQCREVGVMWYYGLSRDEPFSRLVHPEAPQWVGLDDDETNNSLTKKGETLNSNCFNVELMEAKGWIEVAEK